MTSGSQRKSQSPTRTRSRSPPVRVDRTLPGGFHRRESRRSLSSQGGSNLCSNCRRAGHFARDCPHVAVCNNCALPGHIASECSMKQLCWNCREPGHTASKCPNEGICHSCGRSGHRSRDCSSLQIPPGDVRLCNNCFKQGHFAAECTNPKACKNCRRTGHVARDCTFEPVCNLCNVSGHVAKICPKFASLVPPTNGHAAGGYAGGAPVAAFVHGGTGGGGYGGPVMDGPYSGSCYNCGGRGHMSYHCPSARFINRPLRRF